MIRLFGRLYYCILWAYLPAPKNARLPLLIIIKDDEDVKIVHMAIRVVEK